MKWIRFNDWIRRLARAASIAGYVFLVFGPSIAGELGGSPTTQRADAHLLITSRELAGLAMAAGVALAVISATLTAFLPKHELLWLTWFVIADFLLLPFALLPPI